MKGNTNHNHIIQRVVNEGRVACYCCCVLIRCYYMIYLPESTLSESQFMEVVNAIVFDWKVSLSESRALFCAFVPQNRRSNMVKRIMPCNI